MRFQASILFLLLSAHSYHPAYSLLQFLNVNLSGRSICRLLLHRQQCPCVNRLQSGLCDRKRSAFLSAITAGYEGIANPLWIFSTSTLADGSESISPSWPGGESVAPGCSLGCNAGGCAVSADTIRLIYWPVTERATGPGPVTVVALESTFTSPTVYVSFKNVYASNSCSIIGRSCGSTIVAVTNPSQLSSIWSTAKDAVFAGDCCTASFNFTDLNTPIPQSIYDRQPQYYIWFAMNQGPSPSQVGWNVSGCPRTAPYAPIGKVAWNLYDYWSGY